MNLTASLQVKLNWKLARWWHKTCNIVNIAELLVRNMQQLLLSYSTAAMLRLLPLRLSANKAAKIWNVNDKANNCQRNSRWVVVNLIIWARAINLHTMPVKKCELSSNCLQMLPCSKSRLFCIYDRGCARMAQHLCKHSCKCKWKRNSNERPNKRPH